MSAFCAGVRLCVKCSEAVGLAKRAKKARIAARSLPASVVHHAKERKTSKAGRSEARRQMRADVWAENVRQTESQAAPFGACDCGCGGLFVSHAEGECDHWIERSQGGTDTRENGWRLLSRCHRAKTNNSPDRAYWNEKRRTYCERAGIPFVNRRAR